MSTIAHTMKVISRLLHFKGNLRKRNKETDNREKGEIARAIPKGQSSVLASSSGTFLGTGLGIVRRSRDFGASPLRNL